MELAARATPSCYCVGDSNTRMSVDVRDKIRHNLLPIVRQKAKFENATVGEQTALSSDDGVVCLSSRSNNQTRHFQQL